MGREYNPCLGWKRISQNIRTFDGRENGALGIMGETAPLINTFLVVVVVIDVVVVVVIDGVIDVVVIVVVIDVVVIDVVVDVDVDVFVFVFVVCVLFSISKNFPFPG